mmetsp:Transcript_52696/g.112696  ORF Transcript_52696/g.112696 Transcript_52696/m.112696 type:complete len:313 (-) Transcript_52696:136-1074(-)
MSADLLTSKISVGYRSDESFARTEAQIFYDSRAQTVQIQEQGNSGSEPMHTIKLNDMVSVKARDYIEGNTFFWTLALQQNEAPVRTCIQFYKREARDLWDAGLQALLASEAKNGATVSVPSSKYIAIKEVTLEEPRPGFLVSVVVDVGKEENPRLEVPHGRAAGGDCKQITHDFIEANMILPTEGTALYRFVRAAVQRAQVEAETAKVVEEINSLQINELIRHREDRPGSAPPQYYAIAEQAKARLKALSAEIPKRIGDQGTAAVFLAQILRRNIEKMIVINELAVERAGGATTGHAGGATTEHADDATTEI